MSIEGKGEREREREREREISSLQREIYGSQLFTVRVLLLNAVVQHK